MIDCVILAGGINKELDRPEEVRNKALIKIGEKEIIRYILEAYASVKEMERVVLVGPAEDFAFLQKDFPVELIQEKNSIGENLLAAVRYLQTEKHLLVSTADIPLVTPAAVLDFLEKCSPFDGDFYYPVIPREVSEKKFPGARRTYVTFQEGAFTGGNIFLVNPRKIEPSLPAVNEFIEHRKNPLKMVSLLGAGFLLLALMGKVTIPRVEQRFSSLLKVNARAVITAYAEIGFDVDKPEDLELVRRLLEPRI